MDKTAVLGTVADEQVVVLEVAGASYAVNIGAIAEIIPRPNIVTVPRSPMYVEGIIDLRGRVIPVVDLRGRLGLTGEGVANRVVIAEVSGQTIGMIVDGVTEVLRLPSGSVEPPPKAATGTDSVFLRGVARLEGRLILLLDLDLVLNGGELDTLAEMPESASV